MGAKTDSYKKKKKKVRKLLFPLEAKLMQIIFNSFIEA